MSLAILLIFGFVAFLSSFFVILLNQDATQETHDEIGAAAPVWNKSPKVSSKPRNTTIKRNETINVPIGVDHFFWRGRQGRLVKLIEKTKKKHRHNHNHTYPKIIFNMTIRCRLLYDKLHLGTGNLVYGFYGMRLAAAVGGVDLVFHCISNNPAAAKRQGSILSWLQGYFPAPTTKFSPYDPPLPTVKEAARGMGHCPLHYTSEAIRHDLRSMALQLVGPRKNMDRELLSDMNISQPMLSNVELDDVAIHFRCGDVARGFNSGNYGIVRYDAYRHYISPSATSIGIVTTSFNETLLRRQDRGTARVCQHLVTGLKEYLQQAFPRAKVSIRNGRKETLALAYARLVMANQTFCSPSTFSIFPTVASFGMGYVQKANLTWFVTPIANHYKDVTLMDGPILSALTVGLYFAWQKNEAMRSAQMLSWLVSPFCNVTQPSNETEQLDRPLAITCGENETTTTNTSLQIK